MPVDIMCSGGLAGSILLLTEESAVFAVAGYLVFNARYLLARVGVEYTYIYDSNCALCGGSHRSSGGLGRCRDCGGGR